MRSHESSPPASHPLSLSPDPRPLLSCPWCKLKFPYAEMQQHQVAVHPSSPPSRHEDDSSGSQLEDCSPLLPKAPVEDDGVLSVGLAYSGDGKRSLGVALGTEGEESQPVFRKPQHPVAVPVPVPVQAAEEVVVVPSASESRVKALPVSPPKRRECGVGKKSGAPTLMDLAIERKRRTTGVIDVDEEVEKAEVRGLPEADIEEVVRGRSPEVSSIPDVVDEVQHVAASPVRKPSVAAAKSPRKLVLMPDAETKGRMQLADVEAFAARADKEAVAKPPEKKKKKKVAHDSGKGKEEADEWQDDEEVEVEEQELAGEEEGSSLSQAAVNLKLTGSSRTTRRRRKELEKMIGSEVMGKRSEAAVFAELTKKAKEDKNDGPTTPRRDEKEEAPRRNDGSSRSKGKIPKTKARTPAATGADVVDVDEPEGTPQKRRKSSSASAKKRSSAVAAVAVEMREVIMVNEQSPSQQLEQEPVATAPMPSALFVKPQVYVAEMEEVSYSQIPKEKTDRARIYDLSQPSQLLTLPLEEDDEPFHPPRADLSASYAATPEDVMDNPENVKVAKKLKFSAPAPKEKKSTPKKGSPSWAQKKKTSGSGWTRGKIGGVAVKFSEARNPKKIFTGFNFIVTGCKVMNELDPPEKHIAYMVNVGSEDERKQVLADWIHDVIVYHGGKELMHESLSSQQRRLASMIEPVAGTPFTSNIVCISEKPHRTIKWMLAVAAGVPCVKWKWLHECVKHNKLMDYTPFLLKSGYSIVSNELLPYRKVADGSLVFDNKKIEVSGSGQFREQWSLVLREQGAECVQRLGMPHETSLHMILSEESLEYPSEQVKRAAAKLKIPIVTIEYAIQCILHHKLFKVSEYPEFKAKRRRN